MCVFVLCSTQRCGLFLKGREGRRAPLVCFRFRRQRVYDIKLTAHARATDVIVSVPRVERCRVVVLAVEHRAKPSWRGRQGRRFNGVCAAEGSRNVTVFYVSTSRRACCTNFSSCGYDAPTEQGVESMCVLVCMCVGYHHHIQGRR